MKGFGLGSAQVVSSGWSIRRPECVGSKWRSDFWEMPAWLYILLKIGGLVRDAADCGMAQSYGTIVIPSFRISGALGCSLKDSHRR